VGLFSGSPNSTAKSGFNPAELDKLQKEIQYGRSVYTPSVSAEYDITLNPEPVPVQKNNAIKIFHADLEKNSVMTTSFCIWAPRH
jgi:hypothetical protein